MADKFQIHLFTAETRPDWLQDLSEETGLLTLFLNAGLDRLHIRRPGYCKEETEDLIRHIPEKYRNRLTLHDYPEIALKYGCGFQLNQRNEASSLAALNQIGEASSLTALNHRSLSVSRSCHTDEETAESLELDFFTLSPVYDSISKPGYKSRIQLQELPVEILKKTVALGGVTLDHLSQLEQTGCLGAALMGAVWHSREAAMMLLKHLRMRNFTLQFITDGKDVEETVEQACRFINAGGKWVQVRMKDSPVEDVKRALEILQPICAENGATLIVDDHYELTDYCDGVHLGQNDAPVEEVRGKIAPHKIIGLTVNTLEQIRASLGSLPDYYGVGPFRHTATKRNLAPVLGLEGYRRLAPELPRPFVAIGGIRLEDIDALKAVGIPGIAVSSLFNKLKIDKNIWRMIDW